MDKNVLIKCMARILREINPYLLKRLFIFEMSCLWLGFQMKTRFKYIIYVYVNMKREYIKTT